MRLNAYLATKKLPPAEFSRRIGVSQAAVARYVSGRRIPESAVMRRIVDETGGAVTPNDFYSVAPPTIPSTDPDRVVVTVHIDADILDEAERLGTDIAAIAERALTEAIAEAKRAKWRDENHDAIAEANEELARNGLWSDGLRLF